MSENNNMSLPTELCSAVTAIKQAILKSQYRAAKMVNREQLSLYFGIGRYISEHSREGYWGTGAIESISEQLQRELPGLRGFGVRQLKNMRTFYEEWNGCINSAAVAAELQEIGSQDVVDMMALQNVIRPPMAVESSVIANRSPTANDFMQQEGPAHRRRVA